MNGRSVSGGIALGRAMPVQEKKWKIDKSRTDDWEGEKTKFLEALSLAVRGLQVEKRQLLEQGESERSEGYGLLEAHEMMLLDEEMGRKVESQIRREGKKASWAVDCVFEEYRMMFAEMEDPYLRARAADCVDVRNRILAAMENGGGQKGGASIGVEGGLILLSKELLPSDLLALDKNRVVGILTERGGANSHIAILARNRNIPALIGVEGLMDKVAAGDQIIVDGDRGEYVVNPSSQQLAEYREKQRKQQEESRRLLEQVGRASVTKKGKKIRLLANIGSPDDLEAAVKNDAEGVGLFRTEFLFMDREEMPGEEEQYRAYRKAAEAFRGKEVIIRTLDAGGDKDIPYLKIPREDNPFLGYRAIRLCLDRPALFKVQLRALLRANEYGNIKVMIPMICQVEELLQVKKLLRKAFVELNREGIALPRAVQEGSMKVGIMIETPAAVMISEELAREADFFSIGTNDLIQYTLAADRTNQSVAYLYDPHHPAIKKMIRTTIENGHKHGIPVGLCGEAGSDPAMMEFLLRHDIDEVSMSAGHILRTRAFVRSLNL